MMRFKSPTLAICALLAASMLARMKPGYGFTGGGWSRAIPSLGARPRPENSPLEGRVGAGHLSL